MRHTLTSRAIAIMLADWDDCPFARAKALYNLGIKGGTTRKQVNRLVENGMFA